MVQHFHRRKAMDITHFKDQELEASFKKVVQQERKIMHLVILHVQELERRQLFLARGFSSLFEYLTLNMKYSGAAAQRRIDAARLLSVVPSVAEKIESGELNLSQIGEIQKAVKSAEKIHQERITSAVKAEIVEKVSHQSTPATQQICAEMLNIPIVQSQKLKTQKDKSKRIEITLTEEQFTKFEKLRNRYALKNFRLKRTQEIADVLESIFDELLKQDDVANDSISAAEVKWKALTPKRKKLILQRDQACQFKDHQTGGVCGSQFQLEVDHIQPKWDGGENGPGNLRILCRQHNQFRNRML
jgi:hypothetical protein